VGALPAGIRLSDGRVLRYTADRSDLEELVDGVWKSATGVTLGAIWEGRPLTPEDLADLLASWSESE
jgi:hypothetical protein